MLVDPKEGVYCSNCRSAHEDGVIAVSRTVTLIATDPSTSPDSAKQRRAAWCRNDPLSLDVPGGWPCLVADQHRDQR
jgi:hypothetical protein